jgi:hypothetical protein
LDPSAITSILSRLQESLSLEELDRSVLGANSDGEILPAQLTRLSLHVARAGRSWSGIVVGFPGTKSDLATTHVGTPFLRVILYPILALRRRAMDHYGADLPCIYLIGDRFSDVFLRKFRFLAQTVPHAIVLTKDIVNLNNTVRLGKDGDRSRESYVQNSLCDTMRRHSLTVPDSAGDVRLTYLAREVPTCEGTQEPERLDILAVDKNDGTLVAVELKGPKANKTELDNLFFQGLEHRDWLEANKMAIKLLVEGPRGRSINTRKRVKLILGFFGDQLPSLFPELRARAHTKDPHLRILFARLEDTAEAGVQVREVL